MICWLRVAFTQHAGSVLPLKDFEAVWLEIAYMFILDLDVLDNICEITDLLIIVFVTRSLTFESKNMHYYHMRVIISCWTSRVYSLTTYDYLWIRFRCTAVSVNGWVTNSVFSLSKAGSFAKSKAREQRFTAEIFCMQNLTSDTLTLQLLPVHYSYSITLQLLYMFSL